MEPNQNPTPKNRGAIVVGIIIVLIVIAAIVYAAVHHASVAPVNNTVTPVAINPSTGSTSTTGQTVPETFTITGLTVTQAASFPSHVTANVAINLAETCSSATGSSSLSGKTFTVTITATKPAGAICGQVVAPRTIAVDLPVTGLAAGTYTVKSGTFTKTFTLAQDNQINYTSGK